jgi:hypothetical protein
MEKDFHLSVSTDIKIIRRSGRIVACDRKRNKYVFTFMFDDRGGSTCDSHIAQYVTRMRI